MKILRYLSGRAGTSIPEAMMAAGVVAVAFGGLFHLSVRSMGMLRVQSEMALASEAIQEHCDYLRSLPWGGLTTSVSYTNYSYSVIDPADGTTSTQTWTRLLNSFPTSATALKSPVETVTISAYQPTGTPPTPIVVTNTGGTITVTPNATTSPTSTDLSAQKMVRVDLKLAWTEERSLKSRTQEACFIVSQKGVGK